MIVTADQAGNERRCSVPGCDCQRRLIVHDIATFARLTAAAAALAVREDETARLRERIGQLETSVRAHANLANSLNQRKNLLRERVDRAEAERDVLLRRQEAALALCDEIAALAPADDWGDSMDATVAADTARRIRAALSGDTAALPGEAERP